MKLLGITFIFIIISHFPGKGQEVKLNSNCKEAYELILALKFDEAHQKLNAEKELNPQNLYISYLENYIDFLTVFISEDEDQFKWLEENKSKRISEIKQLSDTSRFRNYMLGNIHLQWAVARLKFKEYITAAFEINKAYRLLEQNAEYFPEFIPNKISLGALHVMIGMVPEKYQWLLNLISMKGSVEQGREELEYVLQQSNNNKVYKYLRTETLFYLGFIELNINPRPEQIDYLLSELELSRKDNLLLSYLAVNTLIHTGQNGKALLVLNEKNDLSSFYPFHYLEYLNGNCHIRKLETDQASKSYHIFLSNFNGKNYIADGWRKMGWAALIENRPASYHEYMKKVIEFGNDEVDVDKEAIKEAESGIIPNIQLIKSRLLFDGGYYQKADSVLANLNKDTLDAVEKIEWQYRQARIAHESGNIEEAKLYYKKTIEEGSWSSKYFAGNSCLKLGEILENENNIEPAKFYYSLCIGLKFDEYENSIHTKAKAGLERLKSED